MRCLNLRSKLTELDGDKYGSTLEDNDDYYVAQLPSHSTFIYVLYLVGACFSFRHVARVLELERSKYASSRSVFSVVTLREAEKMTSLIAVL